jgi:hypothetical protein
MVRYPHSGTKGTGGSDGEEARLMWDSDMREIRRNTGHAEGKKKRRKEKTGV